MFLHDNHKSYTCQEFCGVPAGLHPVEREGGQVASAALCELVEWLFQTWHAICLQHRRRPAGRSPSTGGETVRQPSQDGDANNKRSSNESANNGRRLECQ